MSSQTTPTNIMSCFVIYQFSSKHIISVYNFLRKKKITVDEVIEEL